MFKLFPLKKSFKKYFGKKLFLPASGGPFCYLDKIYRGKTVDKIFSNAFDQLFLLAKAFPLKGDIFEFGVFRGYTAHLFAKNIRKFEMRDTALHLFDSFVGLPEAGNVDKSCYECVKGVWSKGAMGVELGLENKIHKKLSKILSSNRIHVIKGFFNETLEAHFNKLLLKKAKMVHLDCDLYSSSKYVLNFLVKHEIVQDGTLLIFDDWMCSHGNPHFGQRRAVQEILQEYPNWSFEKYMHYGIGSHVFIAHDLRVMHA